MVRWRELAQCLQQLGCPRQSQAGLNCRDVRACAPQQRGSVRLLQAWMSAQHIDKQLTIHYKGAPKPGTVFPSDFSGCEKMLRPSRLGPGFQQC